MTSTGAGLFVGDISWDTTLVVDHMPAPDEKVVAEAFVEDCGGVVANSAAACALTGMKTQLIVGVPSDWATGRFAARLEDRGVDVRRTIVEGPLSRAVIVVAGDGEKRLILAPGATMYPPASVVDQLDVARAAWVHTALYDLMAARILVERCRASGVRWSIDLEPATLPSDLASLSAHLDGCQTVFVNDRAASQLGPDPVECLLGYGVVEVVETLGPRGARITTTDRRTQVSAGRSLGPVVDTTGAGDALAGQYVAGRIDGRSPADALRRAVFVASASCTRLGGQASYLSRSEVEDLMNCHSARSDL